MELLTAHQVPAAIKLCLLRQGCKVSGRNQLLTKSKAEAVVKVYPGAAYFLPSCCSATCRKVDVGRLRNLHYSVQHHQTPFCRRCLVSCGSNTIACQCLSNVQIASVSSFGLCCGWCVVPIQSVCLIRVFCVGCDLRFMSWKDKIHVCFLEMAELVT